MQSINAVQEQDFRVKILSGSSWPPFGFFYISLFGTPMKLIMIKYHDIHKYEMIILYIFLYFLILNKFMFRQLKHIRNVKLLFYICLYHDLLLHDNFIS